MDPNFIKLYKMAQLTIEYLLVRLSNWSIRYHLEPFFFSSRSFVKIK